MPRSFSCFKFCFNVSISSRFFEAMYFVLSSKISASGRLAEAGLAGADAWFCKVIPACWFSCAGYVKPDFIDWLSAFERKIARLGLERSRARPEGCESLPSCESIVAPPTLPLPGASERLLAFEVSPPPSQRLALFSFGLFAGGRPPLRPVFSAALVSFMPCLYRTCYLRLPAVFGGS